MSKHLSAAYRSKKCDSCGVVGKYYAKGMCNSCYTKARLDKNPETKERYKKNHKNKALQKHYGITLDQYDQMFAAQGGRCAVCAETDVGSSRFNHFAVDHDHKTGKVRALLCSNCNLGLGHFHDDETKLEAALRYLRGFRK